MNMIQVFSLLLTVHCTLISFQSGTFFGWYYTTWVCNVGSSDSKVITFTQPFATIPKVILAPNKIDSLPILADGKYGYQLETSEITTTSFKIIVTCPTYLISSMWVEWIAIDDSRIEVINKFKIANPTSIPIPHNNVNANYGFVFFQSFLGKNTINFTLKITSITSTTVNVAITSSNLDELGYTIVLGPSDAFVIGNPITNLPLLSTSQSVYCSNTYTKTSTTFYFQYFQYFKYSTTNAFKLMFQLYDLTTTYQYCLWTWGTSTFDSFCHSTVIFSLDLAQFLPMIKSRIRIAQLYADGIVDNFSIFINEMFETYSAQGTYSIMVPKSIQNLNISFFINCLATKKVQAKFLQCTSCLNKYFQTAPYQCKETMNYVNIHVRFQQVRQQYQVLTLSISENIATISQTTVNYATEITSIAEVTISAF